MPRILRIANRLNIGGPTFNVAYLAHYLAPEYETKVLAGMIDPSEGSSAYILDRLGIVPEYVPHMHREIQPRNDWRAYREIKAIIRDFKPDIVHTHAAKAGALGRLAAHHCGVPVVVHTFHGHVFHSYFGRVKTRFFLQAERYLARRTTAIVAISALQKHELVETYRIAPAEKVHVVPNGFELEAFWTDEDRKRADFRARHGLQPNGVAVGIVGRLVPVKNHELFLRTLAHTKANTPQPVKGLIIGDGELRGATEAMATQLGLKLAATDRNPSAEDLQQADVVFTSWITDIAWALAGLDVLALTSLNEGTPVSVVEAQAAARPVLCTDVGGVRDTLQEGITGFAVPLANEALLAQRLLQLVNDPHLRQRMGQAGRTFARQHFGHQRLVNDMRLLYERLLAKAGVPTGSAGG